MRTKLAELTDDKVAYGYPLFWFEPCSTLIADAWIYGRKIYIDGCSGIPIRMKNKFRIRAGWA